MKTLHQIVTEEIAAFQKARTVKLQDFGNPEVMHEIAHHGEQNKAKMRARLEQDPALRALIHPFIDALWAITAMALPPQMMNEMIEITLGDIVVIWERANDRFHEQLTAGPIPPQS